jgi:hypothetical protein
MACNCTCSEVKAVAKLGLQPIDLLRLLLNVNAQLVAVLLLDLLVAELFGLVQSAIELYNDCLPYPAAAAFFGPLDSFFFSLPGYSTLVVWRLNRHRALAPRFFLLPLGDVSPPTFAQELFPSLPFFR